MHSEEDFRQTPVPFLSQDAVSVAQAHTVTRMMFFVNLVATGSISAAAERMGISVSTGSRWLSDLEKDVGCALYRRNNKTMPLTDAGDYLYRHFGQISERVGRLKNDLSQYSAQRRGTIRICCTPIYAEDSLMPVVAEYMAGHRQINIRVRVSPFGLNDWQEHDIIIGAANNRGPEQDHALPLVKRHLLSVPFVTVASAQYLLMNGTPRHPAELMRHRCLCADWLTGGNDWAYDIDNRRRGFKIPKSMEVDGGALLLSAALSGAGIAYLPEHVVQRYISQGKLIHLFENINTSEWALDMYYPPQNQISECVSSFKRFLIEQHKGKFSGQRLSVH